MAAFLGLCAFVLVGVYGLLLDSEVTYLCLGGRYYVLDGGVCYTDIQARYSIPLMAYDM